MTANDTTTHPAPHQTDTSLSSAPIVVGDSLSKIYARGTAASGLLPWQSAADDQPTVTALEDVSVTVKPGEIVGLAGPSGSGKSTLLHLLAGLERPDRGRVVFDDTDLSSLSTAERRAHRLHNVGIVFQRFHLLDAFSAQTNVALPLLEASVSKRTRRERAAKILERVGLGDRLDHKPGQLSGGEQQRVAIARALVTEPELIVADEPTGELDSEAGERVLEELAGIADDQAVVVASHDRQTLETADRVVHLQDGQRIESERTEAGKSSA